jgi:L-threonylcarbamoyladenylate synthase
VSGSHAFLRFLVDEKRGQGMKVGILTTEEAKGDFQADVVLACGQREKLETVASSLYETLRAFNETDIDIIFSEQFPEQGVGQAIMNRLNKAAGHRIIREVTH